MPVIRRKGNNIRRVLCGDYSIYSPLEEIRSERTRRPIMEASVGHP
jgi:hypothetical protein